MTTIIKAADAAHFLGLVPHLLGFHPTRSIVLIPFAGTGSLGAMRMDLDPHDRGAGPDASTPMALVETPSDAVDRIASTAIGMVCRVRAADGVAVIIYTDETIAGGDLPREQIARALARRADACGLELRDALCVAGNGWASFLDPDRPDDGHPLGMLQGGDRAESLLPVGPGDQHDGATLPEIEPERLADVSAALEALAAAVDADPATIIDSHLDPRALDTLVRLDDIPELLEEMLEWDAPTAPPFDAALAVVCLSRPAVRDIALLQWSGAMQDGDAALDAQLRWESGEPYPEEIGRRLWGDGPSPEPGRLAAALRIAQTCAALTDGARRAAVLGLCAWLAWAQGRSTVAAEFATRAQQIDADAGLAEIVLAFVNTAHLPEWAFDRAAA